MLHPERYFDPDPHQRAIALDIYAGIKDLPLVCPHGHVDPALFATPGYQFGNPTDLIVRPDHYLLRMLYSQGITYERLLGGDDPREPWRVFASHFHLFLGTPSGMWLAHSLETVFGVTEKLCADTADVVYNHIEAQLALPANSPRALFERFNVAVLATTDAATDTLAQHRTIRASGWGGRIIPTFRPDAVVNMQTTGWRETIDRLSATSGIEVANYASFIRALEQRRTEFKSLGATATDSGVLSPATQPLSSLEAESLFSRALKGGATAEDATRFTGHMLYELARMSADDGLVMQIHPGALRSYNAEIASKFGPDRGFDIPVVTEFTRSLHPMLERFGNHPNVTLILFTLDETTYARELAPLAGAYPSVKLGPPWWFYDSWNGIRRFFDQVMETAGVFNTVGFNDDTRAFTSIPARHDLWRRASANWLASLVARHMIDRSDAEYLAQEMAIGLAKRAYRL